MLASSKARRQALTEFRRQEILAAALKTFGNKGFAATRAEDIAVEAGIAKGTLYLYFRSKEDIYVAAVHHAIEQLHNRVRGRLRETNGIEEKIFTYVRTRLEFWLEQKSLYRLLLTVGREPQHRKQTNAILKVTMRSLVELFEEGVAADEIANQSFEAIAWAVVDMIRGANERRLDGVAIQSIDDDAQFIVHLTLQFLGRKSVPPMISLTGSVEKSQ
jgi:AcrR family transcriptional regulator